MIKYDYESIIIHICVHMSVIYVRMQLKCFPYHDTMAIIKFPQTKFWAETVKYENVSTVLKASVRSFSQWPCATSIALPLALLSNEAMYKYS